MPGERARVRRAVALPHLGDVLDRREGPGDPLVVERPGLEPVAGRPELVRRQRVERLGPPVQHADVRPEELVDRAGEEVRPDGLDVDRQVRRGVDRVDVGQRARLVRAPHELADRVDRPDRVRGPAERDELRPAVEDRVERLEVERDVVAPDPDRPDREPAVRGDAQPRPDVRLVVEPRDDELVARLHARGDRARDVHRERRHVRAELDLVRARRVEQVRERRVRLVEDRVGPLGRGERAAVVRVRGPVVVAHRLDHGVRDLRAARAVEERHRPPLVLEGEGGEPGAQGVDVERRHGDLGRWAGTRCYRRSPGMETPRPQA